MINSGFNTGIALLLFGQLLAQILSGLSNETIPANILLTGTGFIIGIILLYKKSYITFPKLKYFDFLFFSLLGSFFLSSYMFGQGSTSIQKQIGILYLIILPSFIMYFLSLSVKSVDIYNLGSFIRKLAMLSISVALIMFLSGAVHHIEGSSRLSITGVSNVIWFGRYLGIFIVVLVMTYKSTTTKMSNFITISLILMAIYLMLAAGARGPFIAVIAAIIYAKFKIKSRYLMLGLLFIIFLPYIIELSDVADYLVEKEDFSGFNRINLIKLSLELINDNPISGIGFGNFGLYSREFDDSVNFYPHNILAEVFVECGILSFLLLLLLIKQTFDLAKNNVFFTAIFVYAFVNALFSGDITGNSLFFTSMFAIRIVSDKKLINADIFTFIRSK